MKNDSLFLDEKQREIVSEFEFLVPLARGFEEALHDTRYVRWAVQRYQHFSDWIFYRKLVLSPQGMQDLVQPANPFGVLRSPASTSSILEKYEITIKK
jgi:hypothetical protein